MSPTDKYEANCSKRHAYIFNNELFDKLESRRNSQKDVYNLSALLGELNFTVVPYKDLTAEEMHEQLQAVANADHSKAEYFLCALFSHGDDGIICGKDYDPDDKNSGLKLQDVFEMFRGDVCASLKGKPKIFLIQACRGEKVEKPVMSDSIVEETEGEVAPGATIPAGADFLVGYASSEGYKAFRDRQGSWYIQDFCKAFQEHGIRFEFVQLLTYVNRLVSNRAEIWKETDKEIENIKQMPSFTSKLRYQLYL